MFKEAASLQVQSFLNLKPIQFELGKRNFVIGGKEQQSPTRPPRTYSNCSLREFDQSHLTSDEFSVYDALTSDGLESRDILPCLSIFTDLDSDIERVKFGGTGFTLNQKDPLSDPSLIQMEHSRLLFGNTRRILFGKTMARNTARWIFNCEIEGA